MTDLVSRLNQEVALRQFRETKVKDLEVELKTNREYCDENMQQAVLIEREKFTQIQWNIELVWKQCLEMEVKLKNEQDERAHIQSSKLLITEKRLQRANLENYAGVVKVFSPTFSKLGRMTWELLFL
ncbi:hypothetical protein PVK06_046388 [Gossypium arboreum]|uniref:Uncharacterized protein n=1 Tax=Gossypium arboreum TaxID=29729 RepID=A0ABR0MAW0_GOSAR|nr:hypothetical protein PVK06_046388 [Gossypium arboreum]